MLALQMQEDTEAHGHGLGDNESQAAADMSDQIGEQRVILNDPVAQRPVRQVAISYLENAECNDDRILKRHASQEIDHSHSDSFLRIPYIYNYTPFWAKSQYVG